MTQTKVATCCYCGTRAALVLRDTGRHELSCSSCGAPLHDMKMLRRDHPVDHRVVKPSALRGKVQSRPSKDDRRRKKPRKSFKARFLEEALDLLEDIFD